MKFRTGTLIPALLIASPLILGSLHAQPPAPAPGVSLIGRAEGDLKLKPSSAQVTATTGADGISVKVAPGEEGYPGVEIGRPDGKPFDLSAHGHVEAKVTNTGTAGASINLRLDNDADWKLNPYNAENVYLKPGESGVIKLIFGHSYGKKKGYPLKSGAISKVLFFTGKAEAGTSFRIDSFVAGGKPGETPPVDPATIRTLPDGENLFTPAATLDAEKQLEGKSGVTATVVKGEGIRATFPGGKSTGSLFFKPVAGRWDLTQCLQVVVKIRNEGSVAVSPQLRLESNGGPSDSIDAAPIEPGKTAEIAIPFTPKTSWVAIPDEGEKNYWGGKHGTGAKVTSDAVASVVVSIANIDSERVLVIESVKANLPPTLAMPEWLGKRPPVEGDWEVTFNDDFNGTAPDASKWNVHAENYWDKASYFTRDNLIMEGGFAKLRYEKKTGRHNDDPKEKEFHYATGFLDTYDKWTQRYGYFETRAKLPRVPGLWPAFWLMPDRGREAGEKWRRQDTNAPAMEFDIVEHLTRWGPYRYNIAMHWDGYGEKHKQTGSDKIYAQPDKDGFVTSGLLWLPGQAIYYFNGKEVARWESPRISSVQSHLMYTLPQGGWDNNEVDDSQLPADFVVDYVRVWQRKDLAAPAPASR